MKKIYLVDDSRLHRHIIGRELSKLNYDVRSFGEARDLLTALDEQGLPDAIVSDVGMPQMDGLELCRRVRKQHPKGSLPFVMVSSMDRDHDRLRGFEAGADAYQTKPLQYQELDQELLRLTA